MQRGRCRAGVAFLLSVPTSCFSLVSNPAVKMASPATTTKMDEYRGKNHWQGLIPDDVVPRKWDEGFRSFLLKYGMLNQVVYDVFIKNKDGFKDEKTGLRGMCRFDTVEEFSEKGLEFSYVKEHGGEKHQEYDFTNDYEIVANLVCSPRTFRREEDNWFGFMAQSKDKKEMVIVFRGTETNMEWAENATGFLQQLESEPAEIGLARLFNRGNLMCHVGFQQLYSEEADKFKSPKETIHETLTVRRGELEQVTVVGHSLGGAMAQHCAIDLAHSKVLGDVPILCLAWAAPKVGNGALAAWVQEQPNLRVLRIRVPLDKVASLPPDWLWGMLNGGFQHLGTELSLSNTHLHKEGIVNSEGGNSPNHNLEMYLHNIDPTRDVVLMNKVGNVIPEEYALANNISPQWHSQTYPRTIYHKSTTAAPIG